MLTENRFSNRFVNKSQEFFDDYGVFSIFVSFDLPAPCGPATRIPQQPAYRNSPHTATARIPQQPAYRNSTHTATARIPARRSLTGRFRQHFPEAGAYTEHHYIHRNDGRPHWGPPYDRSGYAQHCTDYRQRSRTYGHTQKVVKDPHGR